MDNNICLDELFNEGIFSDVSFINEESMLYYDQCIREFEIFDESFKDSAIGQFFNKIKTAVIAFFKKAASLIAKAARWIFNKLNGKFNLNLDDSIDTKSLKEKYDTEIECNERAIEILKNETLSQQDKVKELYKEINKLHDEKDDLNTKIARLNINIDSLNNQIKTGENTEKELLKTIEELKGDNYNSEAKIKKLEETIEWLQESREKLINEKLYYRDFFNAGIEELAASGGLEKYNTKIIDLGNSGGVYKPIDLSVEVCEVISQDAKNFEKENDDFKNDDFIYKFIMKHINNNIYIKFKDARTVKDIFDPEKCQYCKYIDFSGKNVNEAKRIATEFYNNASYKVYGANLDSVKKNLADYEKRINTALNNMEDIFNSVNDANESEYDVGFIKKSLAYIGNVSRLFNEFSAEVVKVIADSTTKCDELCNAAIVIGTRKLL